MKIFSFVATLATMALPSAFAWQQNGGVRFQEALARATLTEIVADVVADQPRHLRQLEFTEACNATLNELTADPDLTASYETYSANWDAALSALNTSNLDGCAQNDAGTEITCDYDMPIDGEDEVKSTCVAAGGEVDALSMDINCTMSMAGESGFVILDLPSILNCYPSDAEFDTCADSLNEGFASLFEFMGLAIEASLAPEGFTDVSCDVGVAPETGGGVSAPAPAPGGSEPSGAFRSILTLGTFMAAVVGVILAV